MRILVSPVLSFLRDPIIPSLWDAPFQQPRGCRHRAEHSCELPGVRNQNLLKRSSAGGGCDHPRGSRTSWAGSRGSTEELRPPFDAAKSSAALTGSPEPFALQSTPRQSSAPIPVDWGHRAALPGVIWGSCDKSCQGTAPRWSDLLSSPFPGFLLSPSPFPALRDVLLAGCRGFPPSCWNCRARARFWGRAQVRVSRSAHGCGWNPGWMQESSPAVSPPLWGPSVTGFECSVPRRWLGEGTGGRAGSAGLPAVNHPGGSHLGTGWPGHAEFLCRKGNLKAQHLQTLLDTPAPQMISQKDGTKSGKRSPLKSSLSLCTKQIWTKLQSSPGALGGIFLLVGGVLCDSNNTMCRS